MGSMAVDASAVHLGFDIPVELQLVDRDREHISARLRRVNSGFLQLHSPIRIAHDRKLEVLYEGNRIEAEVTYCHSQELAGYRIGLRISGAHGVIRQELRLPVKVRATLNLPGDFAPMPARVVDMSQSGLGLILAKPVPEGISASLDLGYGIAFGEIRYCQRESNRTCRAGFWLEEFINRAPASRTATKPAPHWYNFLITPFRRK
jgi:hypothetical protein